MEHIEISKYSIGDRIAAFDNQGREYRGVIKKLDKRICQIRIEKAPVLCLKTLALSDLIGIQKLRA